MAKVDGHAHLASEVDEFGNRLAVAWTLPEQYEVEAPYPEQFQDIVIKSWIDSKDDLGIAFSGGGMRAATLTLGWLRALNKLKILSRAKYISVNSGASWVNLPLLWAAFFPEVDHNMLLGTYVPPEQFKFDHKHACYEKSLDFQSALCKASFATNVFASLDFRSWGSTTDEWSLAVRKCFFDPIGLPDVCYDEFLERIHELGAKKLSTFPLPFLIIVGTVVHEHLSNKKCTSSADRDLISFIPFEFTPYYCGFPVDPDLFTTDGDDKDEDHGSGKVGHQDFKVGRGFIQPHAFNVKGEGQKGNKELLKSAKGGQIKYHIAPPAREIKLSEISGISSSAIIEGYYETLRGAGTWKKWLISMARNLFAWFEAEAFYFYHPNLEKDSVTFEGDQLKFADGGCVDNSAVCAQLRRGVRNLIICNANNVGFDDDENMIINMADYASLFGAAEGALVKGWFSNSRATKILGEPVATYNKYRQVFEKSKWKELITALRRKMKKGQAPVHSMRLKVVENKWCGVSDKVLVGGGSKGIVPPHSGGGAKSASGKKGTPASPPIEDYMVNAVFVFNGRAQNWIDAVVETSKEYGPAYTSFEKPWYFTLLQYFYLGRWLMHICDMMGAVFGRDEAVSYEFPYIPVTDLNYSDELVNMLTGLSTWSILTEWKEFKKVFPNVSAPSPSTDNNTHGPPARNNATTNSSIKKKKT